MKRIYIIFVCIVFLLSFVIVEPLFAAEGARDKNSGKIFQESGYGYAITYPQDWAYVKQTPYIIVFTKKEGPDANVPVVGIQNLLSSMVKDGKYKDVNAVLADFENQLKITKHAEVYPAEKYTYSKKGSNLAGKQFVAEYIFKDKNYKQWAIVLPRKNGEVFHVWIYSAPAEQFDRYLATVQAMLDSWAITE